MYARFMQLVLMIVALATTCSAVEAGLAAPKNVAAQALSSRSVRLTWTDGNSDIVGFVVERSLDPKRKFKEIATTPDGSARSYEDTGRQPATTYYYRLRALQERRSRSGKLRKPKKSKRSDVAAVTTLPADGPTAAPTPPPPPPPAPTPAPGSGADEWAARLGGTGHDIAAAVAVDGGGHVVVTGRFTGAANLGGGTLGSAGGDDVFLARYTADGTHLWSRRFGGAGNDRGNAVAVDAAGNVLVAGSFEHTASFGGSVLASAGTWDGFVAKFAPDGTHLWSQRFGDGGLDAVHAVAVDGAGNVLLGGTFQGVVSFGGTPLATSRSSVRDLFVARLSPAGAHQWSRGLQGDGDGAVNALAVDAAGNVALAGYFAGAVTVGGTRLTSASFSRDVLVASLSASGGDRWGRQFGGTLTDSGNAIAVDAAGDVFVTGVFATPVSFGGGAIQGDAAGEVFVAKYGGSNGAHRWSRSFGGLLDTDTGRAVSVAPGGDVVVTGSFRGSLTYPADFGGALLAAVGLRDVFVARYSSNGVHRWSEAYGSSDNDDGGGLGVGPSGQILVTGSFSRTAAFPGGTLSSVGGLDAFLLNLAP